jgi:formaldehyde-activating enzyme involved in methanogenesis
MSNFLKASAVRDTVLSALSRMLTIAPTVWRDAGGSFRGVANDTITIRVPAYTVANSRALRSGSPRERKGLYEAPVQVTLSTNLYRDVVLTDEHQTLDIMNFGRQVMNPILEAIARGIEDGLVSTIVGADYEYEVSVDASNPYTSVVQARKHLNDGRAPFANRYLAVGSSVAAALLESPQFARADQSGTTQSLREGVIGRVAGFTTLESPAIPPDEGYAYHQTAYALSLQAPVVPRSFTGFTVVSDGFAIRFVQVPDPDEIVEVVAGDVFVGSTAVMDSGTINADGVFTPSESINGSFHPSLMVRAVKLELTGS